ncbi:MAG: hypothetical protein ACK4RM_04135 [Flavobacterium sp.]
MKKGLLFLMLIALAGCSTTKKTTTSKDIEEVISKKTVAVSLSQVNTTQKNRAYELGKRILLTCNTSQFKPFTTAEATPEVIQKINRDKISMTCHQIQRGFGTFNDMTLQQVWRDEKNDLTIYRFVCDYEKKYRTKEMRVIMNDNNQVTAIATQDWKEGF